MAHSGSDVQTFVNTIRSALNSVNPQVPFVDSSPSNQIQATDPYTKRYVLARLTRHAQQSSVSLQSCLCLSRFMMSM